MPILTRTEKNDLEEYETYQDPGVALTIEVLETPTARRSQTISGTVEQGATVTVEVTGGGVAGAVSMPTPSTWSCILSGLQQGLNGITVRASFQDRIGVHPAWIFVNSTGPVVDLISPVSGPTGDSTPLLQYSVSGGSTTVAVKVDGVVVNKVSGEELDQLSDGDHTVRVEAVDDLGNMGFAQADITVVTQYNNVVTVPGDLPTIQAAIENSAHGTMILVSPGTYPEHIDFQGKALWLKSAGGPLVTIIDGGASQGSVVTFNNGETSLSILEGFTIQGGSASQGGGIYCGQNTSPVIRGNLIISNQANLGSSGGGIYVADNSEPLIVNNLISANVALDQGGGIYAGADSAPVILNNTFDSNNATSGGGIYCALSSMPFIMNNIVTNSLAGGGIYAESGSSPDCDFNDSWSNTGGDYLPSALQGANGISGDPGYRNAGGNDFSLSKNSPCVDSGNTTIQALPSVDLGGQPRVTDGDNDGIETVDMGAYEYQLVCTYDVGVDFSATHNPAGAWSYGWSTRLTSDFSLFLYNGNDRGLDFWRTDFVPVVAHNGTSGEIFLSPENITYQPGQFALHPGSGGQYAHAIWTAPEAGDYYISAVFFGLDSTGGNTDVHVLYNGTELFSGTSTFTHKASFITPGPIAVQAGDTVDFAVGYGEGGYWDDTTALSARIFESQCSCVGDADPDNDVDGMDLYELVAELGATSCSPETCPADLNRDYEVDSADVKVFATQFGRVCGHQ